VETERMKSMNMIDWWTVRGGTWGVENMDFKVELTPDDDLLTKDYDAYTATEQLSLARGSWQFVTVTVTPLGEDLVDHVGARQKRDGVEWGEMPDGRIDRDDLADVVEELVGYAVMDLRRSNFEVKTMEGSPFTPEKQQAPF
jgi:hypothetical protein